MSITLENRVFVVQAFLQSLCCYLHVHHHHSLNDLRDYLITLILAIVAPNYSCIMLVNVLKFQNNSIKIVTYSQKFNYAGILGSSLHDTRLLS